MWSCSAGGVLPVNFRCTAPHPCRDTTGYAQVVRMLGNGRLTAHCFHDDKQRMGTICGKMRKRVWVAVVREN